MRLEDKIAIITGSGAGIGKSICEKFASEGAYVVVSSRRETNGKPVANNIIKAGGKAVFIKCDISVEEDINSLFNTVIKEFGRIDILVNNAGVNFSKPFIDTSVEDWDRVINTDLKGTFICSKRAVEQMLKTGGGSIINITSVHTKACLPEAAPYDSAKWGVVGLTKSMAVELATKKIRVNALSPGLINTQIWKDIQEAAVNKEECIKYWNSNIPMERVGESEEISNTALFLASDESSYVTGSNIIVDGGMTSQLISKPSFESKNIEGGKRN